MAAYSILIEMQANIARLQRDVNESKRIMSGFANDATRAFKGVAAAAGLVFGPQLLAQGIRWVTSLVSAIDEIDEAAQGVGVTAQALVEMRESARFAGVEANRLDMALAKLANRMDDAVAGNKEAAFMFERLGVNIKGLDGNLLSTDKVMAQVADRFASWRDGAEKTAAASTLFGDRLGRTLIPYLNQGSEGLRRFAGLTDEMVEKNKAADAALDALANSWQRLKFALGGALGELVLWVKKVGEISASSVQNIEEKQIERLEKRIKSLREQLAGRLNEEVRAAIQADLDDALRRVEELSRAGLDRFVAGSRAAREADVVTKKAAPSLQVNKEAVAFVETLQKQVWQLEKSEGVLLRIEARQKGAAASAEPWIIRLEKAKATLRDIELVEERITAQEKIRAQVGQVLSGAAQRFTEVKTETEELGLDEFERRRAEVAREFQKMRAEVSISGLSGEELESALKAIDEWNTETINALREQQQELQSWGFGWRSAVKEYVSNVEDGARRAQEAFQTMMQGLEDLFMEFFETGRINMRKFLSDLALMVLRSGLRDMLASLLKGLGGSSGSFIQSLFQWVSGKASGGTVSAGRPVVTGERGPELFIPASNGVIIPNERASLSSPGVVINQSITIDSRSDQASILAAMEANRQRTLATVSELLRRRSPLFN